MRLKAARHTTINFRHRAGKGWFWGKGNSLLVGGSALETPRAVLGKGSRLSLSFGQVLDQTKESPSV